MAVDRPVLWKHNYAMRMLRWLILRGTAPQVELMREYRALGAKGTNFDDNFGRYTCTTREAASDQLVILQTPIRRQRYQLEWVGAPLAAWLAATPVDELQLGFETMERAMLDNPDDPHFVDWVQRLRAEIQRRTIPNGAALPRSTPPSRTRAPPSSPGRTRSRRSASR